MEFLFGISGVGGPTQSGVGVMNQSPFGLMVGWNSEFKVKGVPKIKNLAMYGQSQSQYLRHPVRFFDGMTFNTVFRGCEIDQCLTVNNCYKIHYPALSCDDWLLSMVEPVLV